MVKKLVWAVVFSFLILSMVASAFAEATVYFSMDTYGVAHNKYGLKAEYVSSTTDYGGVGQRTVGDNKYLDAIYILFSAYDDEQEMSGDLRGVLLNGTDYTIIENSTNVVAVDGMTEEENWESFVFSGNTLLNSTLDYVYGVILEDGSGVDAAAYPQAHGDGSSGEPNCVGTTVTQGSNTWTSHGLWDLCIVVYTDSAAGDPPEVDEEDLDVQYDASYLIEQAAEFLVPVTIMLLPAVLFVIFFKRTDKWLILIGLAIGTGLGFYFGMIPVWLVFLVAIGLIGLAYSEVRRNG